MRNPLRITSLILLLAASMAQSGCGGGSSSSTANHGFTITVLPSNASVVIGSTRVFTAEARDSSGDVLSGISFSWHSSDTLIAISDGGGGFRGVALGTVTITASATIVSDAGKGVTSVVSPGVPLTVVAAVEGTAAQGAPLADASVSLRDAKGQYAAASADAAGHFQIEAAGMTAPFLLKATTPDGHTLYGMAADLGTANVDPYTDLLVRSWYAQHGGDADAAFADRGPLPQTHDLQAADSKLVDKLSDVLAAQGLDATHFSLLSTPFTADHSGFDGVLDQSRIDVATGSLQVAGRSFSLTPKP